MWSFEKLVLAHLKDITGPSLDPLQFAYRANRSVDDAVNMELHYILQPLDKPGNYARILFVDFSSAFNPIMPDLLSDKLTQLSVPTFICQWITTFLTDRQTHIQNSQHQHWRFPVNHGLSLLNDKNVLVGMHISSQKLIYEVTVSVSSSRLVATASKTVQ